MGRIVGLTFPAKAEAEPKAKAEKKVELKKAPATKTK